VTRLQLDCSARIAGTITRWLHWLLLGVVVGIWGIVLRLIWRRATL